MVEFTREEIRLSPEKLIELHKKRYGHAPAYNRTAGQEGYGVIYILKGMLENALKKIEELEQPPWIA